MTQSTQLSGDILEERAERMEENGEECWEMLSFGHDGPVTFMNPHNVKPAKLLGKLGEVFFRTHPWLRTY